MIYTLTFNPSIDYVVNINSYEEGTLNRSFGEKLHVGGKGINVSLVLKALDLDSTALGFSAGFTGEVIRSALAKKEIIDDFIALNDGFSRINIKMKSQQETEINGQGPTISDDDMIKLYNKLYKLKNGDILILAGSVPSSLPSTAYSDILEKLKHKSISVIVDSSGELLTQILKYEPFLIKPNHSELNEIFGKDLRDEQEIIDCAKNLQSRGAKNVLVSLGDKGAILVTEDNRILKSGIIEGKAINTTGSGDSMVAGFISGYLKAKDFDHAFKLGVAAGIANAFSSTLPTKDEILNIYNKINEESFE